MEIMPFEVEYLFHGSTKTAEVKPCCKEDNVVDFMIWIDGKLAFNLAKSHGDGDRWVVSLKNADKEIEEEMIRNIGKEIDKKYQK